MSSAFGHVPRAALALAICVGASPVWGQAPTSDSTSVRSGLLQPGDWMLGAVFVGSAAIIQVDGLENVDKALKPDLARHDAFYRRLPRTLGRIEVSAALSAGTLIVGQLAGSSTVSRVGIRSLEALALGAGLATALKVSVGRARPDSGFEEDRFAPLTFTSDHWSFPSGHTVNAFALATIVSSELKDEAAWVPFVVYPFAAWTGVSRMLDRRHWFTDVVAGASLGIFSGLVIERLHGGAGASPGGPRVIVSAGEPFVAGLSFSLH